MTDTRKKDFITRLAVKNLKGKLDLIKEKSTRERIIELINKAIKFRDEFDLDNFNKTIEEIDATVSKALEAWNQ